MSCGDLEKLIFYHHIWLAAHHLAHPDGILTLFQLVYILFHHVKGTPFVSGDQGNSRRLTSWEQMDDGEQLTANKKFIIGVTILL